MSRQHGVIAEALVAMMSNLQAWLRRLIMPSSLSVDLVLRPGVSVQEVDPVMAAADRPVVYDVALALLAEDNNEFAVALHGQLRSRGGNQFFSPFSIRTAVLMTYGGARSDTAAQMRAALHVSMPDAQLYEACAAMVRSLSATGEATVAIANAIWSQEGAAVEPAFMERIARYFAGSWNTADFRSGSGAARASINRWVSEQTGGKIVDLLGPGSPGPDSRLVVVNAAYFKGKWVQPFDTDDTRTEPFFLEDGRQVRARLMRQTEFLCYLRGPDYQAVTLAYQGSDLCMLVLVPDRRDGLDSLETALSAAMIRDCLASDGRPVHLVLPRFTITWGTLELRDALIGFGMQQAFAPEADFSGITGGALPRGEALFLSSVCHKAFVEVDEEGTEAAAATGGALLLGLPEPPEPAPLAVRADRPFLFAICDRASGAVIFLGRVLDPTRDT
jgi:serpin B